MRLRCGSRANCLRRNGADVLAVEQDARRRSVDQPHDHHRGGGLAAAGFADQADALAARDGKADAVDGAEHAPLRAGGLRREQSCRATPVPPLRGYSFTSFSTSSSGSLPASSPLVVGAAARCRRRVAPSSSGSRSRSDTPEPRRRPHQLPRIGVRRRLEDRLRAGGLHHLALFHHHDAVAIGGGEAEIVGDQDGGHAALARQLGDQVHHRLLRGHVEAGGRLVGDQQAADGRRAPARSRRAGTCRRTARTDRRDSARAGRAMRTCSSISIALSPRVAGPACACCAQHVLDLMADLADRIERGARVLEDHRDFAAAQIAHLAFAARRATSMPVKRDRALGDPPGPVENAHHRIGGDRFARAGLADDAERLALGDADVDVLAPRARCRGGWRIRR